MIKGRQKRGFVRTSRRGFTMTESVITLGVVGLVVGAIWGVWGQTSNSSKMEQGVNEIRQIAMNIRNVYTGQTAAIAAATMTSMVCSDIFMPSLMTGADVDCGGGIHKNMPINAWGGAYQVDFVPGETEFNIDVYFPGTPPAVNKAVCNKVIDQFPITAAGQEGGPTSSTFRLSSWHSPAFTSGTSPSQVASDLSMGCSAVRFQFRL
jgi:prepilin-type N-terminal cleavage/methylation domain-containing protein